MVGVEPTRQSPVLKHFECSLLRPLEYICIFNFVARNFPQGVISSQPRYDHFDTAANAALQINLLTAQLLYQKGRWQSMLTRGFATVVCQAYARGSTYSKIHR